MNMDDYKAINDNIVGYFLKFKEYYNSENIQNDIKNFMDYFYKLVDEHFKRNAKNKKLTYENDVHVKDLYELHIRKKDFDSIKEKLFRKDNIDVTKSFDNLISEIDDIIGMKIITVTANEVDLANKCFYSFICNNSKYSCLNLDDAKDINKNGHIVYKYKIKGKYNIEVQVDSNFSNSWNEIEHVLFYKDYNYTFGKKNNKKLMEEVGKVVSKVDTLIGQIKDNEIEYRSENYYLTNNIKYNLQKKIKDKGIEIQSNYLLDFGDFLNKCSDLKKLNESLLSDTSKKYKILDIPKNMNSIHEKLFTQSGRYRFFYNTLDEILTQNISEAVGVYDFKSFFVKFLSYMIISNYNNELIDLQTIIEEIDDKLELVIYNINEKKDLDNLWKRYLVVNNLIEYFDSNSNLDEQYDKEKLWLKTFEIDDSFIEKYISDFNTTIDIERKNMLNNTLIKEMGINE